MSTYSPHNGQKQDLAIDRKQALRHVELLTGSPDTPINLRLFHDGKDHSAKGREAVPPVKLPLAPLSNHWPTIEALQSEGYGVFLVVNAGGNTDAEIKATRAVFIDIDGGGEPKNWHVEPDFIVRRDAEHLHAYWRVLPDFPVDRFTEVQKRLAANYGSDRAVSNLSRVMRLAGTFHLKDPDQARLITLEDRSGRANRAGFDLSLAEVTANLPDVAVTSRVANASVHVLDLPHNIARAKAMLAGMVERGKAAVQGDGGDDQTFKAAAAVIDFGLSPEATYEVMEEVYNPHCQPEWKSDELREKIENAWRYRQNAPGAYGVEHSPIELLAEPLARIIAEAPVTANDMRSIKPVVLRSEAMQDARPPTKWLIESILPDGGTVLMHAAYGQYKSFFATDVALAVASGRPAFGKFPVLRTGPVVYLLGEGAAGFEKQRRPAWRLARGIPRSQVLPISTVEGVPQVRTMDDVRRYFETMAAMPEKPVLVVIDTMARALSGLNENDSGDTGLYSNMVEEMARRFGCTVLTIAHDGKDPSRGARGSSAIPAAFDFVWQMDADTRSLNAKLTPDRFKDEEACEPIHLHGRKVPVPGSDKTSLVFDFLADDDYRRASGKRIALTRSEVGQALQVLGALQVNAKSIETYVLASELAGPDADEKMIKAKAKALQRKVNTDLAPYVAQKGKGRRDKTLWWFPRIASTGVVEIC